MAKMTKREVVATGYLLRALTAWIIDIGRAISVRDETAHEIAREVAMGAATDLVNAIEDFSRGEDDNEK